MWSSRDAAVLPWISQSDFPHDSNRGIEVRPNINLNHQHGRRQINSMSKVLQLLSTRERIGIKGKCGRVGWLREGFFVSQECLSRSGAW